nr:hypothetical protein [Tanacetum cinerariifolium]
MAPKLKRKAVEAFSSSSSSNLLTNGPYKLDGAYVKVEEYRCLVYLRFMTDIGRRSAVDLVKRKKFDWGLKVKPEEGGNLMGSRVDKRLKKDQEKDKIGTKRDKNGKRGEAGRRLKQL